MQIGFQFHKKLVHFSLGKFLAKHTSLFPRILYYNQVGVVTTVANIINFYSRNYATNGVFLYDFTELRR